MGGHVQGHTAWGEEPWKNLSKDTFPHRQAGLAPPTHLKLFEQPNLAPGLIPKALLQADASTEVSLPQEIHSLTCESRSRLDLVLKKPQEGWQREKEA